MDAIRSTSWLVSFGLHAVIAIGLIGIVTTGGAALNEGAGEDLFVVDQGISIEGIANLGEAEETIETVDIPAIQEVAEVREIQEIEPELTDVISSTESTNEETVELREPEPLEEVEEMAEVPVQEQAPQVATLIEKSSGAEQTGGDTDAFRLYQGQLFKAIAKRKIVTRTKKSGTVTLEFFVSPEGELVEHKIVKSSGSTKLDEAAVASLERAAPFPPLPESLGAEPHKFTIPFRYRVK